MAEKVLSELKLNIKTPLNFSRCCKLFGFIVVIPIAAMHAFYRRIIMEAPYQKELEDIYLNQQNTIKIKDNSKKA